MTERILKGPFLTRAQAARRAGVPAQLIVHRPDLLRVEGRWLQEAYFAFQFDRDGVRPELGSVVHLMKRTHGDIEIADWLVRSNRSLDFSTPLKFLRSGGPVERVLAAADVEGPISDAPLREVRPRPDAGLPDVPGRAAPRRRSGQRPVNRRPVFGSR